MSDRPPEPPCNAATRWSRAHAQAVLDDIDAVLDEALVVMPPEPDDADDDA